MILQRLHVVAFLLEQANLRKYDWEFKQFVLIRVFGRNLDKLPQRHANLRENDKTE